MFDVSKAMLSESEKRSKLKRMSEIVAAVSHSSTDTRLIQELIDLSAWPEFTGMDARRSRLIQNLTKIRKLKSRAALDECWKRIHSIVSDFPNEIAQHNYTSGNAIQ